MCKITEIKTLELKSCPFCGFIDCLIRYKASYPAVKYSAYCPACEVDLTWEDTQEKAISKWNKRYTEKEGLTKKPKIYLASPYTYTGEGYAKIIQNNRFTKVSSIAGDMIFRGQLVYSPVTHGHNIAQLSALPVYFEYWKEHCFSFLGSWATELHVLMLDGWKESTGVQAEIAYAQKIGLPIKYIGV